MGRRACGRGKSTELPYRDGAFDTAVRIIDRQASIVFSPYQCDCAGVEQPVFIAVRVHLVPDMHAGAINVRIH